MHDLDLISLRLFVAVCETRNIARAGEQQHISIRCGSPVCLVFAP